VLPRYNFFFIAPRFTFAISARQGVITVFLFLAAALVAGRLASRLRMQVIALRAANRHARRAPAAGPAAGQRGRQRRGGAGGPACAGTGHGRAGVAADRRRYRGRWPQPARRHRLAAADWALRHGQPSGRFTDTLAGAQWWFLPLLDGEDRAIGVAGLYLPARRRACCPSSGSWPKRWSTTSRRPRCARGWWPSWSRRVSNETERLRSALLSSVSHDLRSPLAAMIGSADSLASYGAAMETAIAVPCSTPSGRRRAPGPLHPEPAGHDRLGHEGLKINRDWIGVDELIGSAARRLQRYQPKVRLELDIPPRWRRSGCTRRWSNRRVQRDGERGQVLAARPPCRCRRASWTASCAST
jgi:two-component system sensor histidine kinase KdpD